MDYSSRRAMAFWSACVLWTFYYFLRQLPSMTMIHMGSEWGYSRSELGTLVSLLAFSYAASKFLSGMLTDYCSPKLLSCGGLLLSALASLCFPLLHHPTYSYAVVMVLGLGEGGGWPGCAQILQAWYSPSEKGTRWAIVSLCGNFAAAVLPLMLAYVTQLALPWWYTYYILGSGATLVVVATSYTLSMPSGGSQMDKKKSDGKGKNDPKSTHRPSLYQVFTNTQLWCLCGYNFILLIIRFSVINWTQMYFVEHAQQSTSYATGAMGVYQVGGMVGSLVAGAASDWLIRKGAAPASLPRSPGLAGLGLVTTLCLALYSTTVNAAASQVWLSSLLFMLGFAGEGASAIIGLAAMETVDRSRSGSAHALHSLAGQFGNMLAGLPLSLAINSLGWTAVYRFLIAPGIAMAVLPVVAAMLKQETKLKAT